MTSLLLLCMVTLYSFTPTGDGKTVRTTGIEARSCEVVESEEEAALTVFRTHFYGYPDLHDVTLYRLDTRDMTFKKLPLKIVEVKERP